jgi:ParB-like chromosome segregation protein Spo0J
MIEFKTEMIAIDKLIPYHKNAKKHPQEQIEKLAKEINEIGWTQPIVCDSELNIIAGHGRRLAAIKAGLVEVPVHIVSKDISPERIRAMRLLDNKISETKWDFDLLRTELLELQSIEFDLSATAFSEIELQQFLPFEKEIENSDSIEKLSSKHILFIECENEFDLKELFEEFKSRNLNVSLA